MKFTCLVVLVGVLSFLPSARAEKHILQTMRSFSEIGCGSQISVVEIDGVTTDSASSARTLTIAAYQLGVLARDTRVPAKMENWLLALVGHPRADGRTLEAVALASFYGYAENQPQAMLRVLVALAAHAKDLSEEAVHTVMLSLANLATLQAVHTPQWREVEAIQASIGGRLMGTPLESRWRETLQACGGGYESAAARFNLFVAFQIENGEIPRMPQRRFPREARLAQSIRQYAKYDRRHLWPLLSKESQMALAFDETFDARYDWIANYAAHGGKFPVSRRDSLGRWIRDMQSRAAQGQIAPAYLEELENAGWPLGSL
jgi:hypothetical protein